MAACVCHLFLFGQFDIFFVPQPAVVLSSFAFLDTHYFVFEHFVTITINV